MPPPCPDVPWLVPPPWPDVPPLVEVEVELDVLEVMFPEVEVLVDTLPELEVLDDVDTLPDEDEVLVTFPELVELDE